MNAVHLNEKMDHPSREKRLKVSRACFTCRIKKIKCDGIQPCMQCKARKRPCSFSKDGTVGQVFPDDQNSPTESEHNLKRRRSVTDSPQPSSRQSVPCLSSTSLALETRIKEQDKLQKTYQLLDKLSMLWPGEGKESRWLGDTSILFELPAKHDQKSQPLPVNCINTDLLKLFFQHRYTVFPILPKTIFYRLLEHKDSFVTPLLLYSIYCNAAHFSREDAINADSYYRKAQMLLDTYIDTPSLSIIISLCLLSTFESNRYNKYSTAEPPIGKNRSSIYGDMAFRMCYDLKLYKRYSYHDTDSVPDHIELQNRVYWTCYCLDKIQSLTTHRPCLLPFKDTEIDFPTLLKSDDASENEINVCLIEHIKLMQISERALQMDISRRSGNIIIKSPENEQTTLDLDQQLLYWLRNLPQRLQWTPLDTNVDSLPTEPPPNALVAHLHLIYNFVEISILQPFASPSCVSTLSTNLMIQQRCRSVATNTTQLTCAMADQPNFIFSFQLTAHAIMAAIRIHTVNCYTSDGKQQQQLNTTTARHARFMFQRSLRSLKLIYHHRSIDDVSEFVIAVERVLEPTGDNLKLHVLSPIIPRPSTQQQQQRQGEDLLSPTSNNRLNNLFSYGLVSPVSSTAPVPIEKTNISNSRDEELIRPQPALEENNIYHHSNTTSTSQPNQHQHQQQGLINSYPKTASSFFNIPTTENGNSSNWKPIAVAPPSSNHSNSNRANFKTPAVTSIHQEQSMEQPMEMYSNIWSKPETTAHLQHHFNPNNFIIKQQQGQQGQENSQQPIVASATDNDLFSLWNQQAEKNNTGTGTSSNAQTTTTASRFGLGVYASAQQHHTDVIRQHMPGMKSATNRPVLLNHFGQVTVASSNNNNNHNHSH